MKIKMTDRGITYRFGKVFTAVLMAAAMIVGTFTGNALSPATAVYAVTQPDELSYNTGHRDKVCTELGDAAIKYYSGKYSIEKLQAMSGDELKTALHDLMADTDAYSNKVSYSMLTKYFTYTDAEDGKAGTVLFYSDALPLTATETQKATTISREHVWPKAHASFYESGGGADLHHLRPTDSVVNANRSDYCFGNVDKNSADTKIDRLGDKNTGKVSGWWNAKVFTFEPLDNVKGDVARILLYVYTRWEEPNLVEDAADPKLDESQSTKNKNDGKKVIESLDTLFEWMELDPVDTWEMGRNDLAEQVQGNRNVFIDHPELAYAMFGRTAPDNIAIGKAQQKDYGNQDEEQGNKDQDQGTGKQDQSGSDGKKDTDPHPTFTKKTLTVGQKAVQIKISYKAADAVVKYKSSNKKIAKVTKAGKIKPVKEGQATITVTIRQNGKKYVSKITVTVKPKQ